MSYKSNRLNIFVAFLGNLFQHYDTALFGFLSPFLAPLFFPDQDPITALILTFAIIPFSMLAKPLGSLAFGHIGDLYGRKQALNLSLCGMAIISGTIAFCPTPSQIGFLAPLALGLGRALQSFMTGGITIGGAIFILENSHKDHHNVLSGLYNSATIGGILLASTGVSFLYFFESLADGWRYLYFFGCVGTLIAALLSKKIAQKEVEAFPQNKLPEKNLFQTLWCYKAQLCMIIVASGFSYVNYSIALVLLNGFIPLTTDYTKEEMSAINTFLLILDFFTLPFFGWLSNKISKERLMIITSFGAALSAIPLFTLLESASIGIILFVRIVLVLFGVAFCAPIHAWAIGIVPKDHRYRIISLGNALGTQFLGSPCAAVSLWFYQQTGILSSASWYFASLGLLCGLAILKSLKLKNYEPLPSSSSF